MIDWPHIKLLIIDLDETLCNSQEALAWPSRRAVEDQMEADGHESYVRVIREVGWVGGFEHTMKAAKIPKDVEKKYRAYYDDWAFEALDDERGDAFKLFPNALDLLKLPIKKILLSRGNIELQNKKIDHLKIREYFDGFSIIETYEKKKNELLAILERYEVDRSEALIIGDRVVDEIQQGRELKIPTVYVCRPAYETRSAEHEPDVTVRSLKEITDALKRHL